MAVAMLIVNKLFVDQLFNIYINILINNNNKNKLIIKAIRILFNKVFQERILFVEK